MFTEMCEFFEDEIISIELLDDEVETVDISVSHDNLFVANGVLTHNCAYGGEPGLDSVSESISIATTSDVIVSIFQNEEDQELGVIRLGMMKNRFGMRGMVQAMRIDYQTLTVYQSEDDEQEIMGDDELDLLQKLSS